MPELKVFQDFSCSDHRVLDCRPCESLLACLQRNGISLNNPCNGKGSCGKCVLKLRSSKGLRPLSPSEKDFGLKGDLRLACLYYPEGELEIELPDAAASEKSMSFLNEDFAELLKSGKRQKAEGLSVFCDCGTTTVQMLLVDENLELRAKTSFLNPQKGSGSDVLSRISFAGESGENLKHLSRILKRKIISELQKILLKEGLSAASLERFYIMGNPTMLHIFFEVSPASLGFAPYKLAIEGSVEKTFDDVFAGVADEVAAGAEDSAESLKKAAASKAIKAANAFKAPNAKVYSYPSASAFIGSDVLAGAVFTELLDSEQPALLMDIGTNGELILYKEGKLYAASCATGPALEGMNLSCGMRAEAGAIEDLKIDLEKGEMSLKTIDDTEPIGLCGSGVLALLKEALRTGLVNKRGQVSRLERLNADDKRRAFLTMHNKRPAIKISDKLLFSNKDVRQVQLAKTALLAGINALLRAAEVKAEELEKIYIAGQFGYHLRPELLLNCGLLPAAIAAEKIKYLGNTSLKGAIAAFCDSEKAEQFNAIAAQCETISLSVLEDYERLFIAAAEFPEPGRA